MKKIAFVLSLLFASSAHGQFWRETISSTTFLGIPCNSARLGWGYQVSDAIAETSCAPANFPATGNSRKLAVCVCAWTAGPTAFEWQAMARGAGGGGTPGGADTQVQYNDAGAFGGDAGLTFNETTNALTATTFVGALTGNSSTTTALAANGANCSAGSYPLGVNASGAAESCTVAGVGDVVGPASSVDNGIVRYDGNTGKLIQDTSLINILDPSGSPTAMSLQSTNDSGTSVLRIAGGYVSFDGGRIQIGNGSDSKLIARSNFDPQWVVFSGGTKLLWTDNANNAVSASAVDGIEHLSSNLTVTDGNGVAHRLDSGYQRFIPRASPPVTCGDANTLGFVYTDTSLALCFCDATAWQVLNPSTAGVGTCA